MKLGLWTKHDKCIENASNRKATGTEWGMCFTNGDIETCVEASEVKFFILTQKMIAIENWCCVGRTGGYRRLTFRDLFSQRLQAFCQFWMWYDRSYGENAYNFRHNSETHETCANLAIMAFNYLHWRDLSWMSSGYFENTKIQFQEVCYGSSSWQTVKETFHFMFRKTWCRLSRWGMH